MNVKEEINKIINGFRISNITSLRNLKPKTKSIVEEKSIIDAQSIIFGYKPDIEDKRDYKLKLTAPKKMPTNFSLKNNLPPILDQGNLGSCVSNALANTLKYLYIRNKKLTKNWSRLFNYYNTRALENSVNEDDGCQIRNAIKVCNKNGTCFETTWPYTISKFANKPTTISYNEARTHIITSYRRVSQTRNDIKTCLLASNPILIGFYCGTNIFSTFTTKTGNITYPSNDEQIIGGHCVLLVGYDDEKQIYEFMNSWGTKWGNKGYGTIPYLYIENPNLAADFWIIENVI
jgi:C1A family cysteine protease